MVEGRSPRTILAMATRQRLHASGRLDREDGLRGFEVADHDGYVLFFGRPQ